MSTYRWTEHDAEEILEGVHSCIEGALEDAKNNGHELKIAGIGITNQRETTLVWDKFTGKPLHRAIVWHDGRTSHICQKVRERLGSAVSSLRPLFHVHNLMGKKMHNR